MNLLPTVQFAFNNALEPTEILLFYINFKKYPEITKDLREIKPVTKKA